MFYHLDNSNQILLTSARLSEEDSKLPGICGTRTGSDLPDAKSSRSTERREGDFDKGRRSFWIAFNVRTSWRASLSRRGIVRKTDGIPTCWRVVLDVPVSSREVRRANGDVEGREQDRESNKREIVLLNFDWIVGRLTFQIWTVGVRSKFGSSTFAWRYRGKYWCSSRFV